MRSMFFHLGFYCFFLITSHLCSRDSQTQHRSFLGPSHVQPPWLTAKEKLWHYKDFVATLYWQSSLGNWKSSTCNPFPLQLLVFAKTPQENIRKSWLFTFTNIWQILGYLQLPSLSFLLFCRLASENFGFVIYKRKLQFTFIQICFCPVLRYQGLHISGLELTRCDCNYKPST